MREIPLAPKASALIESTRSVGYSFESAIADIIDNSVGAAARSIHIESPPSENPYVAILDDGTGMRSGELQEAMRYGSDPNMERVGNDLGRFGLGMKMASLSQCRRLTVISVYDGVDSACRWDIDRVKQSNDWTLQILDQNEYIHLPLAKELVKNDKGTLVLWEKLDRVTEKSSNVIQTMKDNLEVCRSHLSMTFHRFMDQEAGPNKLSIFINNTKIEPSDPFLQSHPTTKAMPEQPIDTPDGRILIKPFILPPESKMTPDDVKKVGGLDPKMQGFYVYRNKRLILPGTWFKLTSTKELRKLTRVRVDIPNTLDFMWDVDVKKSNATIPVHFRNQFIQILTDVTESGEKRYRYKGRKESDEDMIFVWNKIVQRDKYEYLLNRDHPSISILKNKLDSLDPGAGMELSRLLDLIESSVPYQDIRVMVMDKDRDPVVENLDTDDLLNQGMQLLMSGRSTLENIGSIEPFNRYPKIVEKLKEFHRGL